MDYLIWLALAVVVVVSFFFLAVTTNVWEEKTFGCGGGTYTKTTAEVWCHGAVRVCFTVFALALIGLPAYYELPDLEHRIYSVGNDGLTEHRWGAFRWDTQLAIFQKNEKAYGNIHAGVSVVTENPKVRHVSYELHGHLIDRWLYLNAFEQVQQGKRVIYPDEEKIRIKLRFLAYNFNNDHSKEMAGFYNPLDPTQIERFRALVEPYFNAETQKMGVRTEFRGFSIN